MGDQDDGSGFLLKTHPLSQDTPLLSIVVPVTAVTLYIAYCLGMPYFFGPWSNYNTDSSSISEDSDEGAFECADIRTKLLKKFNRLRIFSQTIIAFALLYYSIRDGHHFFCEEIPTAVSASPPGSRYAKNIAWLIWAFYIVKILDLLDCIFIIWDATQVNVLQMYHHSTLVFICWVGAKYFPGGSTTVPIILNALTVFGFYCFHQYNKTRDYEHKVGFTTALYIMQVIQFSSILLHAFVRIFFSTCGYPQVASVGLVVYVSIFALAVMYFWRKVIYSAFTPICGGRNCADRTFLDDDLTLTSQNANSFQPQ